MNEYRSVLERAGSRFRPPDLPLERIERGRDRRRRNERIRAGAVGLAVAIGVAWLGASVIRSTPSGPADKTRPPVPRVSIDWERVPAVSIEEDAIVDIRTGEVTPLPRSITGFREPGGYAVAPSGEVLLFEARAPGLSDNQIFVANVDGTTVRQLTDAPGGATWGAWSPDGTKVVALVGDGVRKWGRRDADLVLVDVETGDSTRLASGRGWKFYEPHFSPDGQLILFGRFGNQGSHTFGIPVGGGEAALVYEERWNAIPSPDDRTIVYEASASIGNTGGPEVWLADANGSHPRPLVHNDEPFSESPSWSPDGMRIVFTRHLNTGRWYRDRIAVVAVARRTPTFSVIAPQSVAVWLDDNTLLVDVGTLGA